jgi:hypothetical protein
VLSVFTHRFGGRPIIFIDPVRFVPERRRIEFVSDKNLSLGQNGKQASDTHYRRHTPHLTTFSHINHSKHSRCDRA